MKGSCGVVHQEREPRNMRGAQLDTVLTSYFILGIQLITVEGYQLMSSAYLYFQKIFTKELREDLVGAGL